MSITRVIGADKNASLATAFRVVLPNLLVGLLVIYNTIRLFRHAMWRDELQAYMLAAASNTPLDLFARVQYENHPALWYLLLWLVTRFTTDPLFVQVTQLLCALGLWVLIWRVAPFRPYEKLLLLLSYFLFWEYFIVTGPYDAAWPVTLSLRRPKILASLSGGFRYDPQRRNRHFIPLRAVPWVRIPPLRQNAFD